MRFFLLFASFNGFVAVLMGALGAHALAGALAPQQAAWLATALQYQLAHALALGMVAALAAGMARETAARMARETAAGMAPEMARGMARGMAARRWLGAAGVAFSAGMILFCGALYVLALTGFRPAAMLAPIGGLALMGGWLALACAAAAWRRA